MSTTPTIDVADIATVRIVGDADPLPWNVVGPPREVIVAGQRCLAFESARSVIPAAQRRPNAAPVVCR